MANKTVRRSKKALDILHNAKNVKAYTLSNCFTGKDCDRIGWDGQNWLVKLYKQFKSVKLIKKIGMSRTLGIYTLYVHSNEWYEFTCGE